MRSFLSLLPRRGNPIVTDTIREALMELDRRLPFTTSGGRRSKRGASSGGDIAFEVALTAMEGGKYEARIGKGLIAGVEPVIDGLKVSEEDPRTGQPPALVIDPAKDVNPKTGTGFLYARMDLEPDFNIVRIVPVVLSSPPDANARKFRAYKLLAQITRTPVDDNNAPLVLWQAVEHNLGWMPIQRRSDAARQIFYATS